MVTKHQHSDQFKQGYLYAVRLLTASKKSSSEIASRLLEKGYARALVPEIINALAKQGILKDQKIVKESVRWSIESKRLGRLRIGNELKRKGFQAAEVDRALERYSESEEKEAALALARARWESMKNLPLEKKKRRLYSFLVNRGFGFALARETVIQLEHVKDENITT